MTHQMTLTRRRIPSAAAALLAWSSLKPAAAAVPEASVSRSVALLAALYGIPLLGMQRRLETEVLDPATRVAPFDRLHRYPELATPTRAPFRAPNNDTLYATAWLDLRRGGVVFAAPPTGSRYWNAQILAFTTETIANLGQATYGNEAARFAIVGPGWQAEPPRGMRAIIQSPTTFALMLLRVLVDGAQDVPAAAALQARFELTRIGPAPVKLPPLLPMKTAAQRFAAIDAIVHRDPVRDGEQALLAQFAEIGLGPQLGGDRPGDADEATLAAAEAQAVAAARAAGASLGRAVNGWRIIERGIGVYGFDYLRRAAVWEGGPLANVPQESLYPSTLTDESGRPLDGSQSSYVIRFPAGGLPPVQAFWSLTIYNRDTGMLVANPIDRYSIGNRTPGLTRGPDGSLTIHIQRARPVSTANWLPAPNGPFYLSLRLYRPKQAALDGTWSPPPVERVE